eukprot:GCRY01001311.1.p1 GENE.GCRY01001311.1~~GCRY01001311.1.p1  ORF type:complete len:403 (-),score=118.55 GCRY01001311.1:108-1316(-)
MSESTSKVFCKDDWVSDKESSVCMLCGSQFSSTNRRHHCRKCGKLFCIQCCATFFSPTGFDTNIRCCETCVKAEFEAYVEPKPTVKEGGDVGVDLSHNMNQTEYKQSGVLIESSLDGLSAAGSTSVDLKHSHILSKNGVGVRKGGSGHIRLQSCISKGTEGAVTLSGVVSGTFNRCIFECSEDSTVKIRGTGNYVFKNCLIISKAGPALEAHGSSISTFFNCILVGKEGVALHGDSKVCLRGKTSVCCYIPPHPLLSLLPVKAFKNHNVIIKNNAVCELEKDVCLSGKTKGKKVQLKLVDDVVAETEAEEEPERDADVDIVGVTIAPGPVSEETARQDSVLTHGEEGPVEETENQESVEVEKEKEEKKEKEESEEVEKEKEECVEVIEKEESVEEVEKEKEM